MKDRNPDQAHEPHYAFIFLFCLGNFFQNFGPNVTTFVVPAEIFPTRYRTTAYGITAACGKLGAILSQVMLAGLEKRPSQESGVWVKTLYVSCRIALRKAMRLTRALRFPVYALFMFTGLLSTCLIPETKGVTLEDISAEEEDPSIGEVALRQTEPLTHSPALRNRLYDNSPRSF
jgi:PHS family inorganic phosphate transporter-like MFS transporter